MPAVAYRSVNGATPATASSAVVTKPAGVVSGDLLICFHGSDRGGSFAAMTAPAGWTLADQASQSNAGFLKVWTKIAGGSEPASYTFPDSTGADSTAAIVAVEAGTFDPDTPFAVAPTFGGSNTASTSHPAPSVEGVADGLLITCHFGGTNANATRTYTPPAGMTERYENSASRWIVMGTNTLDLADAGATGTKTATCSASVAYITAALVVSPVVPVTVTATDTVTLTDTATIAAGAVGDDTVTLTDTARAGIPMPGTDIASFTDTGTVAAAVTPADQVGLSDQAQILASFTTTDTVALTDAGKVAHPATDQIALTDQVSSLTARVTGTDTFTISDGASIEVLFGDLVLAVFGVDPATGALVPLPDYTSVTLSRERNGKGSISLSYPTTGLNFDLLRSRTTTDRDLEVELWMIGSASQALRGYLQEASGDDVSEDAIWQFAGGFAELRLAEAVAWPRPIITRTTVTTTTKLSDEPPSYQVVKKTTVGSSAGGPPVTTTVTTTEESGSEGTTTDSESTKGELEFSAVKPGALMATLMDEAQARGTLSGMTRGFTATADSNGTAWPSTITTKFSPGVTYESILDRLVDFGLIEWAVTWTGTSQQLDMWVPEGRGVDRTVGDRPIVLRRARNLIDAPRKWSVRESATSILAAGAEGIYSNATDADAVTRRGRRIETSASSNNLQDTSSVQGFAQQQLRLVTPGLLEVTHGIAFLAGEPRPVIAFDLGDWLYSETTGSAGRARLRVVQWTLSMDSDGSASGTVTLNDTITDALSKLKARLDGLQGGDTIVGTSEGSGGQDTSTPLPPEVNSAASIAFLDGTLGVRAAVTVGWISPVLNVDGTVITDLDHFVIQYALASSSDVWNAAGQAGANATSAVFVAPAAQTITIRVAAVDRNGNTSVWSDPPYPHTTSDDDVPPPVPSAAVVSEFLGTVRISWDGKTVDGAVMDVAAIDFDHVEVHLSPGSLFTPSDATLVGRMYGHGTHTVTDLPYGVTQFARFVAVDWSGNKSTASAQGSATPAQVVSADVFDGAIGTAKLADLAVVTAKIANLAVNDAKIGSLSVGKLTAGSLTVDVILAGGGIKTATTGTRLEADSGGLRLYNGANVVVDLKTSNGSALVVGEFRTSLSGQRIVFNPGGALADQMNFYPSSAGDFARIMARTAPGDGTAAILIDGGAANGTSRGRLGAYKGEAFISYVTNDSGGDTSSGFSRTAVSASNNTVLSWVQTTFDIDKYSGSSRLSASRFSFKWTNGEAGSNVPTLVSENNSGIKLDAGAVAAVNAAGSGYVPMVATSYPGPSSRTVKSDIAPIEDDLIALFRTVDAPGWRYLAEVSTDDRLHFGPIAEDIAAVMPELVTTAGGGLALDTRDLTGVTWALLHRLVNVLPDWLLRGDPPPNGAGS